MSSQLPAPANPAHMFVHLLRPIRRGSLVRRQYFDPQTPPLSYSYSALRSVKYSSKLLVNRLLVGVNRHLRSRFVKYSSKVLVNPSLAAIIVPGADPWRVQEQSLLVIGGWHSNSLQSRSMEISSAEFINPFFDSVCIQSLSKVLINSLFIIFSRSRSAKSSSAELVVVVLLPQRRTRKKKQLLTVIRDFASEKTQEERRVSDLKNRVGELRSEIEVATANIEEAMKRKNSPAAAIKCLHDSDSFVDVNFVGDVCLKVRKAEVVLREESPNEVRAGYEEFKIDVTALFLAVHNDNVALARKLLSIEADENQKLFRGYSTTIAVKENHLEILEMLFKDGDSQQACEGALLEVSCYGHARIAKLLMGSDLLKYGVDVSSPTVYTVNPTDNETLVEGGEASFEDYEEGIHTCNEAAKLWMQIPAPKGSDIVRQIGDALRVKLHYFGRRVRVDALEVDFDPGIECLVVGVKDLAVDLDLGVEDLGGTLNLIEGSVAQEVGLADHVAKVNRSCYTKRVRSNGGRNKFPSGLHQNPNTSDTRNSNWNPRPNRLPGARSDGVSENLHAELSELAVPKHGLAVRRVGSDGLECLVDLGAGRGGFDPFGDERDGVAKLAVEALGGGDELVRLDSVEGVLGEGEAVVVD
nr:ankyrin-3 isoform X1 [Ipomoea batatas]